MSPILFEENENRGESGRRRPVEKNVCKAVHSKRALKAHDNCYHRAIQGTLHRCGSRKLKELLIRGRFGVIILHIEGGNVRGGIAEGEDRVGTGWGRSGKGHEETACTLGSTINMNGQAPVTEANNLPSVQNKKLSQRMASQRSSEALLK